MSFKYCFSETNIRWLCASFVLHKVKKIFGRFQVEAHKAYACKQILGLCRYNNLSEKQKISSLIQQEKMTKDFLSCLLLWATSSYSCGHQVIGIDGSRFRLHCRHWHSHGWWCDNSTKKIKISLQVLQIKMAKYFFLILACGQLLSMVVGIRSLVLMGPDSGCGWIYGHFHEWWCNNYLKNKH